MTASELDQAAFKILLFIDRLALFQPNARSKILSACSAEISSLLSQDLPQAIFDSLLALYLEMITTAHDDGLLAPSTADLALSQFSSLSSSGDSSPESRILRAIQSVMLWNLQHSEKFSPTAGLLSQATGCDLRLVRGVLLSQSFAINQHFLDLGLSRHPHNHGRSTAALAAFIGADFS